MNRAAFYASIKPALFRGNLSAEQVSGMEGLLDAFVLVGDRQADTLAYGLATAYHETGARMVPVREGFARTDAGARASVARLARKRGPRSAVARYSQPAGPHGHVYYGRGHVQLTWLENYAGSSADAGVDLVKTPDAMLDSRTSGRVLFKGLLDGRWNGRGIGLRAYANADGVAGLDHGDALEARRTVNGVDRAELIAGYFRQFMTAITAAGGVPAAASPTAPTLTELLAPPGSKIPASVRELVCAIAPKVC